jgi:hypothetical protein
VSSTDSTDSTEPPEPPEADEADAPEEWVRPIDKFRRTAAGSVMAAGLLGLRDVIEGRPQKEEAAIISEAPTAPPPDNIEVVLDFEHPERSVVYLHEPPEDPPEG